MNKYDVVIVGGGPAGLTAGIYLTRARLKTILLEKLAVGGQAVYADCIENYPGYEEVSGKELTDKMKEQAMKFGLHLNHAEVKKIERNKDKSLNVKTEEDTYLTRALIIASGSRPKRLNVAGEENLIGRGVSFCATCDGPFFKDKKVVLVGGGNTAIEEALYLTKFASSVTVIHRRDRLRAAKILQERAFINEKIDFIWDSVVSEILGGKKLEGIKLTNLKTGKEAHLPCQGVFVFIGFMPNTEFLKGIADMDKDGYILTDENMRTGVSGIYCCGDCRKRPLRQIVTACSEGAIAALSCQKDLSLSA